jgi:outer membrane beta-barrel protein
VDVPGPALPTAAQAELNAAAGDPPPASAAEALGRQPQRVKCLDETLIDELGRARARKGVQLRPFRKALRLALNVGGGVSAGDLLDTTWQAGGQLTFFASEDFGLDADVRVTTMTLRVERSFTGFSGEDRVPDAFADSLAYVALGHLRYAPFHTKLRARGDRIVTGDVMIVAGAGAAIHDTTLGVAVDAGLALWLYPRRWLSVQLQLTDLVLSQEVLGSRRISNTLLFSTGIGFWTPMRGRVGARSRSRT